LINDYRPTVKFDRGLRIEIYSGIARGSPCDSTAFLSAILQCKSIQCNLRYTDQLSRQQK